MLYEDAFHRYFNFDPISVASLSLCSHATRMILVRHFAIDPPSAPLFVIRGRHRLGAAASSLPASMIHSYSRILLTIRDV